MIVRHLLLSRFSLLQNFFILSFLRGFVTNYLSVVLDNNGAVGSWFDVWVGSALVNERNPATMNHRREVRIEVFVNMDFLFSFLLQFFLELVLAFFPQHGHQLKRLGTLLFVLNGLILRQLR